MTDRQDYVLVNDQCVDTANATISVYDRGLRFGDGLFETIRIFDGKPYQWQQHIKRLQAGLDALKITYSSQSLFQNCLNLIQKNNVKHGILRIMITRGAGSIGYLPQNNMVPTVIIEAIGKNFPPLAPSRLWVSSFSKLPSTSLPPRIKHMQGLNSTLAKMEAIENQCDEALLLDDQGHICEAASGNIFWVKGNILHTPSTNCPMVEGTMRHAITRLSPLTLQEGEWDIDMLKQADEVFLSNAGWPIMPIATIEPLGIRYDSHSVAQQLITLIEEDMQQHAQA